MKIDSILITDNQDGQRIRVQPESDWGDVFTFVNSLKPGIYHEISIYWEKSYLVSVVRLSRKELTRLAEELTS